LSNIKEIKDRWKEHFETLYNDYNPMDMNVLKKLKSEGNMAIVPDICRHEI